MSDTAPRTLCLVINGKSAGNPELRTAVAEIRDRGVPLEVRVTWESGDAARYAADAASRGIDVVVAGGGDGTINEVVNGLVHDAEPSETAVAVIPFGTANDFATGCGIPKGDPLAALTLATEGDAHRIDVGQVNDRLFVNVASGGFGARVTAETPTQMKKILGGAAYSLMGLVTAAKMTPYRAKLITDEGEESGTMVLMAIGNGRLAGGGFSVAPRALLDDGLLDGMAIADVEPRDFGALLSELMNLGDEANQLAIYRQLSKFRIEADEPVHVNLDGEPILESAFDFEVLPKRVPFILPAGAPLVGSQ